MLVMHLCWDCGYVGASARDVLEGASQHMLDESLLLRRFGTERKSGGRKGLCQTFHAEVEGSVDVAAHPEDAG